ncbi:MAG: DUF1992 domain-containing protein [Peptococcaceae bacterium]|jgi:hypothetical protein|nr:DUF1992 domain-containing protein [Peptococcaceae bacterium]
MSDIFNQIAEDRIQEAMRNGEFDNLPYGKQLNLDDWASLPAETRAGYMLLKNSGHIPEEVQLLKEIGALREQLAACRTQEEQTALNKQLKEAQLKFDMTMELRSRKR